MAISNFQRVCEFHDKFRHPVEKEPQVPTREYLRLRMKLIAEEFAELADACGWSLMISGFDTANKENTIYEAADGMNAIKFNMIEWADALGDLLYVIYGAAAATGVPINSVVQEIHYSNFSKLFKGEPVQDAMGKIQKGPDFVLPDLQVVFARQKRHIELGGTIWGIPTYDE